MLFTDCVYVGIDPTSGRKAYTYAALDRELNLISLGDGELEDVMAFLGGHPRATVAVNAASQVNRGLVRKRLEASSLTPGHQFRGVDLRVAEYELRERGIAVGGTPNREELCPAWVQAGFALYGRLAKLGFGRYPDGGHYQWLETHPHACFCALLGQNPLPKPTLEGRLQRQIILHERGVRMKDPMDFFEEITRYKLVKGVLPLELIYAPEVLDALAAAFTAWLASERPAEVIQVGHQQEGFIMLPASALKEKY
jgi:hypothetical protein